MYFQVLSRVLGTWFSVHVDHHKGKDILRSRKKNHTPLNFTGKELKDVKGLSLCRGQDIPSPFSLL